MVGNSIRGYGYMEGWLLNEAGVPQKVIAKAYNIAQQTVSKEITKD